MRIVIGQGSCGIAAGAEKVRKALMNTNITSDISITGCIGMCYLEPIVDIYDDNGGLTRLVKVSETDADAIASYVNTGNKSFVEKLVVTPEDSEFLSKQTRIALRNCGVIDPENIDAYTDADGYTALKKALTEMTPEEVIEVIKVSGLAGRGGAGFPTWFKWNAARQSQGDEKYLIC
ncbi:MAG: NADH-quinone oxidoreductase subunit F, partial [Ruminococcus sp.]